MEIEYDARKNGDNFAKHGVTLDEAAEVWNGVVVNIPAKNVEGEKRTKTLGAIEGAIYAVIWIERNGKRRLISARKATEKERSLYNDKTNH